MTTLYLTPNEFTGTDSQRINQAAIAAVRDGLILVIPRINAKSAQDQPRDQWLLDEAIHLHDGLAVELHNCTLKLSDQCRDNFFRSANCGKDISDIKPIKHVHILGKGHCVLQGADRPRATGDGAKTLGKQTFGTDAGKADESQSGDWRNIGLLMAHVSHFSIENLTFRDTHCWAISLEHCSHGRLRDLHFESTGKLTIDGQEVTILNQDGLDLRQGCQDILIENISGQSGDDLVALTAIPRPNVQAGTLKSTMVSGGTGSTVGIRNIIIRNVHGHCAGGHHIVRLLNTGELPMDNILIDGVLDTSTPPFQSRAALKIGDKNQRYGGINPLGSTTRIVVNNIISRARYAVYIGGSLVDSTISNVIHYQSDEPSAMPVHFESGQENLRNVTVTQAQTLKDPQE